MASNLLTRQAALETIGASAHYRSCFITSFGFDFSFFEERVMPFLRATGVRNVNVLVDGPSVEVAIETGMASSRRVRTYCLNKCYATAVFHPKLMLFVGPTQGLLLVGSGNLTTSGMGFNDELWAAFHYTNASPCTHEGLFAEALQYLSSFRDSAHGVNGENWDRAIRFAPWIAGLQPQSEPFAPMADGSGAAFLANTVSASIFQRLKDLLPTRGLRQLTVLSPFYDANGAAILQLQDVFQPANMSCIIESSYGTLPHGLDTQLQKKMLFFEWQDCTDKTYKPDLNRLHAKAFHFLYNDGWEYLLLGSANATAAALGGMNGKSAANAEACVLLRRKGKKTYLDELGIRLSTRNAISFKAITPLETTPVSRPPRFKFRILHAETDNNELLLTLNHPLPEPASVLLLDDWGTEIGRVDVQAGNGIHIRAQLDDVQPFQITLEQNGERVSAASILHHTTTLLRNNPDPESEKIDRLIQEIEDGHTDEVTHLLQLVDYRWDEEMVTRDAVVSAGARSGQSQGAHNENTYQTLSESDFNAGTLSGGRLNHFNTNASVRIAEFVSTIVRNGMPASTEDVEESEEAKLLEAAPGDEATAVADSSRKKKSNPATEAHAIRRFLTLLHKNIRTDALEDYLASPTTKGAPPAQHTLKRISNLLLALELIHLRCGTTYIEETSVQKETSETAHSFQPDAQGATKNLIAMVRPHVQLGGGSANIGTVKGFLLHTLGAYLLQSTIGDEDYRFAPLNNKLTRLHEMVFAKAAFWICNFPWGNAEEGLRDTLLLNALHYLAKPDEGGLNELSDTLSRQFQMFAKNALYVDEKFPAQQAALFRTLLPRYAKWLVSYNDQQRKAAIIEPIESLHTGDIVFKQTMGFATLAHLFKQKDSFALSLARGGYDVPSGYQQPLLKNVVGYATMSVVFR